MKNAVLPWRRSRLRRLRAMREVYVNVACGPQVLAGFVNLDLRSDDASVVTCDTRRDLPVGDGAARGIRAEQFVEHLETREELPLFLSSCHRALAPGGYCASSCRTPSAICRCTAAAICRGSGIFEVPNPFPVDLPTRMDVINHVFHQWHEHRWAYDFETLEHRLRGAGFTRIERAAYQSSRDSMLAHDRDVHAPYSLYVEAIR